MDATRQSNRPQNPTSNAGGKRRARESKGRAKIQPTGAKGEPKGRDEVSGGAKGKGAKRHNRQPAKEGGAVERTPNVERKMGRAGAVHNEGKPVVAAAAGGAWPPALNQKSVTERKKTAEKGKTQSHGGPEMGQNNEGSEKGR